MPSLRTTLHLGAGLRSAFVPTDIDGAVLWLRGDLGVTEAGSGVSVWADQSGNGNDFVQTTDALRPPFSAAGFDGLPCLDATGGDFMTSSMASAGNSVTSFAAIWPDAVVASTQIAFSSSGSGVPLVAERINQYAFFDGAYRVAGTTTATKQILSSRLRATASEGDLYKNGINLGPLTYDNTLAWATPAIFGISTGTATMAGLMAELIVYSRALTDAETAQVHAYLLARYGL